MRSHDSDIDRETTLRPPAARLDPEPPTHAVRAAGERRPDVLDPPSVLGLQRAVGNQATGALLDEERSPVHDVVGSGRGEPLAPEVRHHMETRLGHDFGDVRVHTDARAADSAASVGAHAYTVGSDVVFQRDRYDPTSSAGRTTLAHELTHVVQQRAGAVDGSPAPGGIRVSDPGDRFERDAAATAEKAVAEPAGVPVPTSAATAAVQRQEAPEEETEEEPTAQAVWVQRQEAGEGEEEREEEPGGE